MKRFKKMQFADLLGIVALDREWNGYAVDEKSAEVMVRIKQKLSQLEVIGDDERRSLWLPFRTRTKHAYWRTDDPEKGLVWYYLTMTTYRDVHYLMLHDAHFHYVILKTESNCHDKASLFPEDTYNSLLGLEQYVSQMVDWIVANPDEYNEYIANELPYRKRHGKIRRDVLYQLFPGYRRLEDRQEKIQLLERLQAEGPTTYDTITLNIYAHVWRLAYDAYEAANADMRDRERENSSAKSDREMFVRHSNKGNEAAKFDWDSEEDFVKWEKENSPYHNMDVAYARIHLWPHRDEQTGLWELHLSFDVYGYYPDVLAIAEALYNQGIRVVVSPHEMLMGILREDDLVSIVPYPDKYMDRGGTTNQIHLPYVEDDVTEEKLAELISFTEWEPEEQVRPIVSTSNKES